MLFLFSGTGINSLSWSLLRLIFMDPHVCTPHANLMHMKIAERVDNALHFNEMFHTMRVTVGVAGAGMSRKHGQSRQLHSWRVQQPHCGRSSLQVCTVISQPTHCLVRTRHVSCVHCLDYLFLAINSGCMFSPGGLRMWF